MKSIGYKTGRKNHWRRRTWNRIKSKSGEVPGGSILYLSAEEDLDRRVAVSKGFKSKDMVAVDSSMRVVEILREARRPAVCGDIARVAGIWSSPLRAIHADYCGALGEDTKRLAQMCMMSPAVVKGTVVSINVLRGRDGLAYKDKVKNYKELRNFPGIEDDPMHRGGVFFNDLFIQLASLIAEAYQLNRERRALLFMQLADLAGPEFDAYQSDKNKKNGDNRNPYYNSVVFSWPMEKFSHGDTPEDYKNIMAEKLDINERRKLTKIGRQSAAVKAHITMGNIG